MLMGFISLTITILQDPVSKLCVPSSAFNKWTPCELSERPTDVIAPPSSEHSRRLLASETSTTNTCKEGYEPFVSPNIIHQLHIFVVVLALVHVVYSCLTMLLAFTKVYRWRVWENEAHDASRRVTMPELAHNIFLQRQSTFVRYHTSRPWSRTRLLVWMVCFFQQFYIPRSDYLTLRLSFITTHRLKDVYDFHAYMLRTMEDEFETIVGISWWLWFCVLSIWILNIDGTQLYFWTSLVPVVIILVIGTKMQHVISTLALEMNKNDRDRPVPVHLVPILLQPRDQLFWFNRPRLLLHVIHLVLFETAFEFATFIWHVWQFGFHTCLLEKNKAFVGGRLAIGLAVLLFSSYSTLPLYALVTQMGSSYKKAVMSKHVERALRQWHTDAKNRLKSNTSSVTGDTPDSSIPSSSVIIHFKSKSNNRNISPLGRSGRISSTGDLSTMEEGSLFTRSPASTTTTSSTVPSLSLMSPTTPLERGKH